MECIKLIFLSNGRKQLNDSKTVFIEIGKKKKKEERKLREEDKSEIPYDVTRILNISEIQQEVLDT